MRAVWSVVVGLPRTARPLGQGELSSGRGWLGLAPGGPARERIVPDAFRRLCIITADDFGLATTVNEAVETAHLSGVLTAASLMVGAPAAQDAAQRARANPSLRVGLHLTLCDGQAVLPRRQIPDLV